MQNGIISLRNLFMNNIFHIPAYQRAYTWERWEQGNQGQLEDFFEDLRQHPNDDGGGLNKQPQRKYYLGTILLQVAPHLTVVTRTSA